MKAWLFQDHRQKEKHGNKAPWSVGWIDPEGKRRSKRIGSKSAAEKFRRKLEGELAAGTYQANSRKTWKDFRSEYEQKIGGGMKSQTRRCTLDALNHFERLVKPVKVSAIKSRTLDEYVAKRRVEPGLKRGSTVSPATVNKELRHIKAVLGVAHEWEYLPAVPKVRMVKEPKKLARYVTAEHFAAIYQACDVATFPKSLPFAPADFWRALLVFGYMTGWRVSEPLALRRDDLDLESGFAITRAADNKAGRDERVPLHPLVVEHLRKIPSFDPVVFPWYHSRELVWIEFRRIQQAAGINLPCPDAGRHECTEACHAYGFHDLRRAFATLNAEQLSGDALQALMRHKSYSTTQRYINMARQLDGAVNKLHVPKLSTKAN